MQSMFEAMVYNGYPVFVWENGSRKIFNKQALQ
jgi:hypothetical protein